MPKQVRHDSFGVQHDTLFPSCLGVLVATHFLDITSRFVIIGDMTDTKTLNKPNESKQAPEKVLYTPEDLDGPARPDGHSGKFSYERDLNNPGEFPFTRGVHPDMYQRQLWTMRQFSGFGTAKDTNKRYKFLLSRGQTGLSVAFDLPTIMGYDSDHERAKGEVGKCGVAICSLENMETLFSGIPLDKVSTSMTINAPASILLAFYVAAGEKQGVSADKLRGTIQNDILKEYIAQKSWIFPPKPSMRIITDIMAFCAEHVPQWNTISISGYHIREAGSTAVQELAFTLGTQSGDTN
jgi:methylmalonyl-CoA mutase N-terminal domain/subunit